MSSAKPYSFTLPNGMQVILKELHAAPIVSCQMWYHVGSRNEPSGLSGISHWVEHMLFTSTKMFRKGDLPRMVARNGGTFNGATWIDWT